MPTTLYLMRHGETDWNRQRRWQAHLDVPLNDTGRAQARELARAVARLPLRAIYTSDLSRAVETARIVAAAFPGGLPVVPEPRFREHHAGALAGHTLDEMRVLFPDWWAADQADPLNTRCPDGGETFRELCARAAAGAEAIAARHPGEAVGVVAHGGSIRALVFEVLRLPAESLDAFALDNCSVTVIEWSETPRLLALNLGVRWLEVAS